MDVLVISLLDTLNEILASTIVVIAASLLLYNLTRNLNDRVARTSGVVLGCVTIVYLGDVFLALGPRVGTFEAVLRSQWIGIAFMPVAMFHLSDALLATTGLPSRGRRRRVVRIMYLISAVFLLLAAFGNSLIQPVRITPDDFSRAVVSLRAGPVFPVYVAYFLIATGAAFINIQRARQRCIARSTRRRMGYLQAAILTPAIGIFPFSVLLGPGQEFSPGGLFVVNLANLFIILMLLFLAYPLSFFGSRVADRVVKLELLRFMLRGPGTGLLALVAIILTTQSTRIFGLDGATFMPFAVVAVVLLWQWTVHLALPLLERRLVYSGEDYDHFERLQMLGERLLTRDDLLQLLEAVLASTCDYLRVSSAFVASLNSHIEVVAAIGVVRPSEDALRGEIEGLRTALQTGDVQMWGSFWLVPLYHPRLNERANGSAPSAIFGMIGVQARAAQIDLSADELQKLNTFSRRAAQTLNDIRLQTEIYAALEGLVPQLNLTRTRSAALEYLPPRAVPSAAAAPAVDSPTGDPEQFNEQVRAALRHYWGGPGLSNSRLLELRIVRSALADNDHNPARALRAVLNRAIERLKPEGERSMVSPEWTLYNILEQRFMQGAKVRDVAMRLAMSEPDLYRKQKAAIDAVAKTLRDMESSEAES